MRGGCIFAIILINMDGKKEHKNINAKVLLLTIGVLIAITAVLLFVFMDRGRGQINMSDYINVSFGGADGAGTVSCSVDTKKLYERLAGNEKNAVIIRNIDTFVDGISASADATDKLSNGDKVTISVLYDRSLADKIGCRVAGAKFAAEVSGLGDGSVIDIFSNVEVVVAGISPDAYANVLNKWQDDRLKNIAFTLDKATGIKAGDVITVTCEASAEELAEQGISIAESRKQFHVDRVACYADSVQALDMNVIDNIIGECKDAIKTETEDLTFRMLYKASKDSSYLFQYNNEWVNSTELVDALFLYRLDNHDVTHANYLDLVFKSNISNGASTLDICFIFEFSDIVISADGKFEIADTDLSARYVCGVNYNDLYGKVILSKEDSYAISQIIVP